MCALRDNPPGHLNVRAVLRHNVPNKGLHPLRRFAAILTNQYLIMEVIEIKLKQKSLSELQTEQATCEQKLAQLQHKAQQYENRIAYCEKGERRKRTHRLITRGAAVESVASAVKDLTEVEFYAFIESVFSLPEVQRLLAEAVRIHNQGRP